MGACFTSWGFQIQAISKELHGYFKSSPISTGFFLLLLMAIGLNIFKLYLIHIEKKNGYSDKRCKNLGSGRDGPECTHPSYKQGFKDRKNSCAGCAGKTLSITNEDVAEDIIASATWKRIVILIANLCRNILPYVSFIYTLFIASVYKGILHKTTKYGLPTY